MENIPSTNPKMADEIKRRRTFAIISHPDAGKTTLTEKLLLYGGAIHLAGAVKAKTNQRNTSSDWMEIEKQRGISISTSVLQFEYNGFHINLLDTPGHKDFSEDTYRTLSAADAAVMLIDSAKGVEPQTRKLFEVCRMRGIPIFTFMNKFDRPGQDPLDLIDEVEKILGINCVPVTWPIGSGDRFRGIFDRHKNEFLVFQTEGEANVKGRLAPIQVEGVKSVRSPEIMDILSGPKKDHDEAIELAEKLEHDIELLESAGNEFDLDLILNGKLSPVFFGSAMNNFGVERFLHWFIEYAPSPAARNTNEGPQDPDSDIFSSFIFKIQANMDPSHRDRVAFMRICSGKFERGMQVKHARLNKPTKLAMPLNFFGQDRVVIDEAWPGDIVGLIDTSGDLRIGDTLCAPTRFEYEGIPRFCPEHFASIRIKDPMKRKQLKKGLDQLSEEGVVQVYQQHGFGDREPVLAAVGSLQFEVLQHRLRSEYSVDTIIDKLPYIHTRWLSGKNIDPTVFEREDSKALLDRDGLNVVLFRSDWALRWAEDHYKDIQFSTTAPQIRG